MNLDLLRERWTRLAPREQLLVAIAAILLPIAVVVIFGLRPLAAKADRAAAEVTEKRALLADIERVAARLGPQSPQQTGTGGGQSLVLLVDQTTRTHNLSAYLKRNEPDGATGIRLRFENAAFDDLVAWLAELQSRYRVTATAASIDPAQEAGRVSCSVQLARAPGA